HAAAALSSYRRAAQRHCGPSQPASTSAASRPKGPVPRSSTRATCTAARGNGTWSSAHTKSDLIIQEFCLTGSNNLMVAPNTLYSVALLTGGPVMVASRPAILAGPPGARNRVTLAVEALLDGEAEKLTRKAAAPGIKPQPGRPFLFRRGRPKGAKNVK